MSGRTDQGYLATLQDLRELREKVRSLEARVDNEIKLREYRLRSLGTGSGEKPS